MKRPVLWDSSAILAALDRDDRNHEVARAVVLRLSEERRTAFITPYIEAETHALLLRRLGRTVAREWLLTGGLPVLRTQPAEEERARQLIAEYRDKDWSLCDAVSFAVIEARNVPEAFSFDHHFAQFGGCRVLGLQPTPGRERPRRRARSYRKG